MVGFICYLNFYSTVVGRSGGFYIIPIFIALFCLVFCRTDLQRVDGVGELVCVCICVLLLVRKHALFI